MADNCAIDTNLSGVKVVVRVLGESSCVNKNIQICEDLNVGKMWKSKSLKLEARNTQDIYENQPGIDAEDVR